MLSSAGRLARRAGWITASITLFVGVPALVIYAICQIVINWW